MPLFLVDDLDRPLYVVAQDYNEAINAWRKVVCEENDDTMENLEDAFGVQKLCDDDELVVNGLLVKPLG